MFALPPVQLPPPVVAGVHITWPKQTGASAGTALTVKVASARHTARLSLVAVGRDGKPVRALARRTLRTGTFKATVGGAGTYELRITVAGRSYGSWVNVPSLPCGLANGGAQIVLGATSARPGGSLPYDVVNTGDKGITGGAPYTLARRRDDGSWQPLPSGIFPMYAVVIAPCGTLDKNASIPAGAVPGHYRVTDSTGASAEFDVAASSQPPPR
jgi:hypothetical protein